MNGFTPEAYTNLHHWYTKPNTIAYFSWVYYVSLHSRLFFYALFAFPSSRINRAQFFWKGGVNFWCFFQQSNTEGKTRDLWDPWKLNIQHTGTLPASEQSEPRSECATIFRMGGSDKTYTSLICRQTKTAMTDAGDNDTSVIRGRAIKKARGWDSHGAACNSRLCCSLYIRGVENK